MRNYPLIKTFFNNEEKLFETRAISAFQKKITGIFFDNYHQKRSLASKLIFLINSPQKKKEIRS